VLKTLEICRTVQPQLQPHSNRKHPPYVMMIGTNDVQSPTSTGRPARVASAIAFGITSARQ